MTDLVGLPPGSGARFLLPRRGARSSRAGLELLLAEGDGLRRTALLAAVRFGVLRLAPSADPDLVSGAAVPVRAAMVAAGLTGPFVIHLGPPRANRKPVAVVLDGAEPRAIVKVGTNSLTNLLVANEASALAQLSGMERSRLVVPQLLASGQAAGHQFHVQSPLPLGGRMRPPSEQELIAVAREIAGELDHAPVRGSRWWLRIQDRISQLPKGRDEQLLSGTVPEWLLRTGDVSLGFGRWHGDLTRWNCAGGDQVLVWDWERFGGPVPIGFDALHYLFTSLLARGDGPGVAAARLVSRSRQLLHRFGMTSDQAAATTGGYLIEIASRYVQDRQRQAGAQVGRIDTWFPAALELNGRNEPEDGKSDGH